MNDPASGLAQQLLASEELENESCEPWWEASIVESDDADGIARSRRFGTRPEAMEIPLAMIKPISTGVPLFYNVCAIW